MISSFIARLMKSAVNAPGEAPEAGQTGNYVLVPAPGTIAMGVEARPQQSPHQQPPSQEANPPQYPNGQGNSGIVPVNYTPVDTSGPVPAGPQLAQATPSGPAGKPSAPSAANNKNSPMAPSQGRAGKTSAQRPSDISGTELDAALLVLRDMRRKEREPLWEAMIQAKLPDTSPGTGRQAPLSDDWRADLNKIDPTYAGLVEKSAKKYGIPPELLARLLNRESNFDTRKGTQVVNGKRVPIADTATGIPQMFPGAAKEAGVTRDQLASGTAEFQIDAGAKYLAQQFERFKDWPKAVAAYHSGHPTVGDWLNGSGPGFESEEQRREGYVKWDDTSKDDKGRKLPSQWRLFQSGPADAEQVKRDVKNWNELKEYLPYVFLGDPSRYDAGNGNAPKHR